MDIMGGIIAGTAEVKEGAFVSYVQVFSPNQGSPKINTSSSAD